MESSRYFSRRGEEVHVESVPLSRIAAQFGTPCYVYSKQALVDAYRNFERAFSAHPHLICYAVKANPNLALLNLFARLGSGFDIVSGGEFERVLAAGGHADKTVFSGVGKTQAEIRLALTHFILAFNVESESELLRINQVAGEMGQSAPVSLRINPDVDAQTHPHIATGLKQNKFGIPYDEALRLYRRAAALPHVQVNGIDFHIGSQMTSVAPLQDALQKILELVDRLQNENISIAHIDIGGGLGVKYGEETPPVVEAYGQSLLPVLKGRPQKLLLEPGRILVGEAGLLLTRVEYLKQGADRKFAVVDAAMNDLMRPALYDAYHDIVPVRTGNGDAACYDIVGPVCESADCLGRQRMLSIKEGDVLAIMTAGAYGMSMSSNYNTRPMAAEILVEGDRTHIIRQRQTIKELWAAESMVPDP